MKNKNVLHLGYFDGQPIWRNRTPFEKLKHNIPELKMKEEELLAISVLVGIF